MKSVFISYSHQDRDLKDGLKLALGPLVREAAISVWDDRAILAGEEWENEIDSRLEKADIILLLISNSFVASEYAYVREMKIALSRHESGNAVVIPILLRPTDWERLPFAELSSKVVYGGERKGGVFLMRFDEIIDPIA